MSVTTSKGLTIAQAAKLLKVSPATISNWQTKKLIARNGDGKFSKEDLLAFKARREGKVPEYFPLPESSPPAISPTPATDIQVSSDRAEYQSGQITVSDSAELALKMFLLGAGAAYIPSMQQVLGDPATAATSGFFQQTERINGKVYFNYILASGIAWRLKEEFSKAVEQLAVGAE